MAATMKAPTDFELGRAVFLYLKSLPELSADDLSVKSDGEVIILKGSVRSRAEKRLAEKAALEVYGVKALASEIVVRPVAERADSDIAEEILYEFQSRILIPADEVKAVVSNGLVTLEGVVSSEFARMLAEAAAKSLRGIRSIRNNIEVKSGAVYPEVVRKAEETTTLVNNQETWAELGAAESG
jgi:osmotically-inducible protein OsmY